MAFPSGGARTSAATPGLAEGSFMSHDPIPCSVVRESRRKKTEQSYGGGPRWSSAPATEELSPGSAELPLTPGEAGRPPWLFAACLASRPATPAWRSRPRPASVLSPCPIESLEEEEKITDETKEASQRRFHSVSDALETTLKRFVGMKRFPSLSYQFHAKSFFLMTWQSI